MASPVRRAHGAGVAASLLLFALLLGAPSQDAPTGTAPVVGGSSTAERWRFAGFPIVSYGSDVGYDLGAALFLYRALSGHPLEEDKLALSLSYATRGPRTLDLEATWRHLLGTPLRLGWSVHLADNPLMPYWGEGAQLGGLPVAPGAGAPPPPYRYHDRRVFASAYLRGPIAGPVGWHVRARWLDMAVHRPSALLAASAPPGAAGGRVALGEVGLVLDTRDREVATRRGVFGTLAAFTAPRMHGLSDFSFHGWDAALSGYLPLWPGATLAARGLYDVKRPGAVGRRGEAAAVPFFERMLYEGIRFGEGLGSADTVRGVARFRISGEEKMLLNVQLRIHLFATRLVGKLEEWGLGVGLDAGRASQPGYPAVHGEGIAGGLRIVFDHSVLARIDFARGLTGGGETFYVAFGEMF